MFVVTGSLKRTPLKTPPWDKGIRGVSAKMREALMSMLAPSLPRTVLWDLFAGSGSVGIEALSRGAQKVVFFEKNTSSLKILEKNIQKILHHAPQLSMQVIHCDLLAKNSHPPTPESPHVIFADPPYNLTTRWLPHFLNQKLWWPSKELIIKAAHHDLRELTQNLQEHQSFADIRTKKYGSSILLRAFKVEGSH